MGGLKHKDRVRGIRLQFDQDKIRDDSNENNSESDIEEVQINVF